MSTERSRWTAYVVPHTHWDREWYLPFETFRTRLVDVIDRLLDLMASDQEYRSFTLDGQTIVLDDYLAVRPEREPELRARIAEGRLRIGPWHVLADEFLVSPEALVRNLALGARTCASFGDRLAVAYTPDSFGHISQLPLLAREFGLDAIVFERGVGDEGERLRGEFAWLAADGASGVFAHHLVTTYSSAAAIGHEDWELRDAYDPDRAEGHAAAALFGRADPSLADLPEWFRASLARVPGGSAAYATGDALLLMNGSDHLYPQSELPRALRDLNERLPEASFVQDDLEAFVHHARGSARELEEYTGEFRGSRYQHVLSGVLSARMYLKTANAEAQTRLEKYTEPLAALARLRGAPYPGGLLRHAWRTLLQNHPHDSMCGCSVDAVHDEMMPRFAAVHHLAEPLERRAEAALVGGDGVDAIAVFNPHPFPVTRVVEAAATLPEEPAGGLSLRAADGRAAPATVRIDHPFAPGRADARVPRAEILLRAELPPLGFASYRLRAGAAEPPAEAVRGDAAAIENETLRLELDGDDGPVLVHKPSGRRLPLRLRFEDEADAGDTYDFSPLDAPPRTIPRADAAPRLVEDGPLRKTVRLDFVGEVPARLGEHRRAREGAVPLPITVDLTVEADRPSLGVRIELENGAEDHRLRLRLASGLRTDHVLADGHFDLVRRPVRPPEGAGWFQRPQGTNHQRRFVALLDGRHGLAVLNRGLPEYEALPDDDGVDLAITLLRCVGWLSRDDLTSRPQGAGPALPTPGAQCPGRHVFELAVLPLDGEAPHAELLREADLFAAPPRARATDGAATPPGGALELSPPLVMTALKGAESRDALLVRIWNPSPRSVEGSLTLGFPPAEAHDVRFDETPLGPLTLDGPTLPLRMASQEVRTILLVPPKEVVRADESD